MEVASHCPVLRLSNVRLHPQIRVSTGFIRGTVYPRSMYLSPAVRTMRDDPTPGVEATLLVRLDDADGAAATAAVRALDGEVAKQTQFGNLHVALAEATVADLLETLPDGVAAVETVTSELSGDAGEDLDPGDTSR
jgi:hypothetical protein